MTRLRHCEYKSQGLPRWEGWEGLHSDAVNKKGGSSQKNLDYDNIQRLYRDYKEHH